MKLAKLSLAAMVVAGLASSSFAADNLADAFKNGKVSGELKAWYFDKTAEGLNKSVAEEANKDKRRATRDNNENITDFGITLGFVTDSLYGFKMGATFQGVATPFADGTSTAGVAGDKSMNAKQMFKDDQYAPGSVLSEIYLQYALGKTSLTVGRQFITTPLVNGSGSRIFKESFEGAVLVNTDLPQTTVFAGYAGKFQGRTSNIATSSDSGTARVDGEIGDAPTFEKKAIFAGAKNANNGKSGGGAAGSYLSDDNIAFNDAYTIGGINKSINNLTLTAQYLLVTDVADVESADAHVYYTEANYVLPLSSFKLGFDVNFRGSKTSKELDGLNLEGYYAGARVAIKDFNGFGASFAAATTDKSDSVLLGAGNGPATYTGTMIAGSASTVATANTDSYLAELTYDFSKVGVTGLSVVGQYAWTKQGKFEIEGQNMDVLVTNDLTTYAIGVNYAVPALKGLTTSLQYESQEKETTTYATDKKVALDTDNLWFKASYKF